MSQHRRRPFFLWVLFLGLVYYLLANVLRLYGALTAWNLLAALKEQPGPLYLALTGGIFMLVFAIAAAGLLWSARRRGRWAWGLGAVRVAALLYAGWYWVDRLFISQAQERLTGWPFALGSTVVLLGLVFSATAVLAELRRSATD